MALSAWKHLPSWAALFVATTASAHTLPSTVYRGTAGDMQLEVILQFDSAWDGMAGFVETSAAADHLTLETTPYDPSEPLLINLRDGTPLPPAAIELQPFALDQPVLHGRWIDLHTREERVLQLERKQVFREGSRAVYEADLLQQGTSQGMSFRVHARKVANDAVPVFDRITITDKASGATRQVIEGLDAYFYGTDTLRLAYLDDDDFVDFSFVPKRIRESDQALTSGTVQYYLYDPASGRYALHAGLTEMAGSGSLYPDAHQRGRFEYRPEGGERFRPGTFQAGFYRLDAGQRVVAEAAGEAAQ